MNKITIITFGYYCGPAPDSADLTVDLLRLIPPVTEEGLIGRTARDKRVRALIMSERGAYQLVSHVATVVEGIVRSGKDVTVAFGSQTGMERAPAFGIALQTFLDIVGHKATLIHREMRDPA